MERLNVYAASGEPFHSTLTVFILESAGALHLAVHGYAQIDVTVCSLGLPQPVRL